MPQNIVIPVNLVDYSQSIIDEVSLFGFDCDLFGDNIILIRAIPDFLDMNASLRFLDEVFNIFLEEKLSHELIVDKIATKACKAAIKGNDASIKEEEIEQIIYELEHCENKYACPHGRPVITRLSKYEIEKFFKRIL
jgi:DNA mismatch repair protein mutL